jgi:hypothetical protein
MPRKSEKTNLEEWEALLAGLHEATTITVSAVPLRTALERVLDEAREIREGRDILLAAAKEARQSLSRVLRRGHDAAIAARAYLKFHYGPFNAELSRFGVNPIRRGKGRREKAAEGVAVGRERGGC